MNEATSKVTAVQYVVVAYNIIEAVLAIVFGLPARSAALTGFGLGSAVEALADLAIVGRMKRSATEMKPKPPVLAAVLSFISGTYVLIQSIKELMLSEPPSPSLPGMLIALFSLAFMPLLIFWNKRKSRSSNQGLSLGMKDIWPFMLLSLGLLLGLGLNYIFGIWQIDPVAGLLTVVFLYKNSLDSLLARGETAD